MFRKALCTAGTVFFSLVAVFMFTISLVSWRERERWEREIDRGREEGRETDRQSSYWDREGIERR